MTNTHIVADAIPAAGGRSSRTIVCTLQDGRSFQADLVNFDWCAQPLLQDVFLSGCSVCRCAFKCACNRTWIGNAEMRASAVSEIACARGLLAATPLGLHTTRTRQLIRSSSPCQLQAVGPGGAGDPRADAAASGQAGRLFGAARWRVGHRPRQPTASEQQVRASEGWQFFSCVNRVPDCLLCAFILCRRPKMYNCIVRLPDLNGPEG